MFWITSMFVSYVYDPTHPPPPFYKGFVLILKLQNASSLTHPFSLILLGLRS